MEYVLIVKLTFQVSNHLAFFLPSEYCVPSTVLGPVRKKDKVYTNTDEDLKMGKNSTTTCPM